MAGRRRNPAPGLFVTGTDTGVGKTLVACALLHLLRSQGLQAVGFKPVAAGRERGRWADAEALRRASAVRVPLALLCPLRFRAPLAPVQAALLEGRRPNLRALRRARAELARRSDFVVAEGAGGVLVPLTPRLLTVEFIAECGWPAVLVSRAGLGAVNHVLLSLRELQRAGIPVAALILNSTRPADAKIAPFSRAEIERQTGRRVTAVIPCFDRPGSPGALAQTAALLAPAGFFPTRRSEYGLVAEEVNG